MLQERSTEGVGVNWFYAKDGHRLGPIEDQELRDLYRNGIVQGDTPVWCPALPDWQPYSAVASLADVAGPPPPPVESGLCMECARAIAGDDLLQYGGVAVCADCKHIFLQRVRQGTLPLLGLQLSGFGRRFLAKIIDWVILAMFQLSFQSLTLAVQESMDPVAAVMFSLLSGLFGIVLMVLYGGYFLGRYGATPGKMALGLEVVGAGGEHISYARAFGRSAAEIISLFTFYLGYIMAAIDSQHRALHDFICETRVVRV